MCGFVRACLLGYREWSKQRLLRRLLEMEKVRENCDAVHVNTRSHMFLSTDSQFITIVTPLSSYQMLEDRRRHALSAKSSSRLDQEVQATPTEILGFTVATEAAVSVGTMTEEGEEVSELRKRLTQLEEERVELQKMLSSRE